MRRGARSDPCVFGAQDDVCCAPLRAMCVLCAAQSDVCVVVGREAMCSQPVQSDGSVFGERSDVRVRRRRAMGVSSGSAAM